MDWTGKSPDRNLILLLLFTALTCGGGGGGNTPTIPAITNRTVFNSVGDVSVLAKLGSHVVRH